MTPTASPMLTDDTGRVEAIETVRFGVDGSAYEIDLPARNADELRSMAGRYISVARKVQPAPSRAYTRQRHQPRPRTQMDWEHAPSRDAAGQPSGHNGTPRAAQDQPAATQSMAATEADGRGSEPGLTDREKQELRSIADAAQSRRNIVAGRLHTMGLADRDTAGNWWLTDAGRRVLVKLDHASRGQAAR